MTVASPIPLYHLISSAIRRRIEDGDYPVGSTVPTEGELAQEFNVSRATVRQAVSDLVQEGLVSRRRGSGTFVLPAANRRIGQRFRGSLADLMYETSRTGVGDIEIGHGTIPDRIAALLELEEATGTIVKRVRTLDGQPFAYTVNYLPRKYGDLLTTEGLKSKSLMALLEHQGVRLIGGRQSVRPQLASLDLTESLGLPYAGAPMLFVERVLWTLDQHPVEVALTWYREDMYEYTVTFELQSGLREGGIDKFA